MTRPEKGPDGWKNKRETTQMQEELYWEWLCSIPGIYRMQQEVLLKCFGSPQAVWQASQEEMEYLQKKGCTWIETVQKFKKSEMSPEKIRNGRIEKGIEFISYIQEEYPQRLQILGDKPYGIFYRGLLPPPQRRSVAIVGARMCTREGHSMARSLAVRITQAGGVVISGAAYGIDGAAQWAALEAGGYSCAVLGCGADIVYPSSHKYLFERLASNGCILSEFPPGTPPKRYHFPMRNRIISGLSDDVVVVEARKKSGSLITAEFALEQGKQIAAVPGRPCDPLSEGCNELIAHGSGVVLSADEYAKELFPEYYNNKEKFSENITLAPAEKLVYSSFGLHTKSLWELEEDTALSLADLSKSLLSLEQKGLVTEIEQNRYLKMK